MLKSGTVNIAFIVLLTSLIALNQKYEVPLVSYGILGLIYAGVQAYGSSVLSAEFFVPVKWKGQQQNAIAITFDDGPIPGKTDNILDILAAHKVHAAFFCIGNRASNNPSLVNKIHHAGHLVCNHSYWHRYTFDLQTSSAIGKELDDTNTLIHSLIGLKPVFFRPPYGVTNPMVAKAILRRKITTIGWSVRSFDTVINDGQDLLKKITRNLKGGDIILLHDDGKMTTDILPSLLDHINTTGLKIVRLDELLNEKAYA
ncbi:MAG: polysaccharide deacetylase family protein [Chryseolinea sp.]